MPRFSRYRSSKARARARRFFFVRVGLWAALVLVMCALTIEIINLPALRITTVSVEGERIVTAQVIQRIADTLASESVFGIISRYNTVLYPTTGIETTLLEKIPYLKEARVTHKSFHAVTITVKEREPFARWCGDIVPKEFSEKWNCYLLDETGFVFAHDDDIEQPKNKYRFYGALDKGVPVGGRFQDPESFQGSITLLHLFEAENEHPLGVIIFDEKEGEVVLGENTRVRYLLDDEPTEIVRRFVLVRSSDAFVGRQVERIEYFDMRFENRVFFKTQE